MLTHATMASPTSCQNPQQRKPRSDPPITSTSAVSATHTFLSSTTGSSTYPLCACPCTAARRRHLHSKQRRLGESAAATTGCRFRAETTMRHACRNRNARIHPSATPVEPIVPRQFRSHWPAWMAMPIALVECDDGKPYSRWCVLTAGTVSGCALRGGCQLLAARAAATSGSEKKSRRLFHDLQRRVTGGAKGRGVHTRSLATQLVKMPSPTTWLRLRRQLRTWVQGLARSSTYIRPISG